ncbi:phosphorylase b kinase regulatory subunit alpha, skeletal muscle isoform isoform X9 [Lates japonicus]|uniref:Phosphorylase b kinase regulatory subunit alpha, skeletal muscle isoform isoform X9 n=1 Tax=Lates japonicus TaxID=270547 RepID=A0AAD3NM88_LATJO|nr:phosphorylase b kinase regulatory subunit alpha, skeletal muscle isoform isoform X9 [Lates japonicus]
MISGMLRRVEEPDLHDSSSCSDLLAHQKHLTVGFTSLGLPERKAITAPLLQTSWPILIDGPATTTYQRGHTHPGDHGVPGYDIRTQPSLFKRDVQAPHRPHHPVRDGREVSPAISSIIWSSVGATKKPESERHQQTEEATLRDGRGMRSVLDIENIESELPGYQARPMATRKASGRGSEPEIPVGFCQKVWRSCRRWRLEDQILRPCGGSVEPASLSLVRQLLVEAILVLTMLARRGDRGIGSIIPRGEDGHVANDMFYKDRSGVNECDSNLVLVVL